MRGVRQGQQQKVPEGTLPPSGQCAEHTGAKLRSGGQWGAFEGCLELMWGSADWAGGRKDCGRFLNGVRYILNVSDRWSHQRGTQFLSAGWSWPLILNWLLCPSRLSLPLPLSSSCDGTHEGQ